MVTCAYYDSMYVRVVCVHMYVYMFCVCVCVRVCDIYALRILYIYMYLPTVIAIANRLSLQNVNFSQMA